MLSIIFNVYIQLILWHLNTRSFPYTGRSGHNLFFFSWMAQYASNSSKWPYHSMNRKIGENFYILHQNFIGSQTFTASASLSLHLRPGVLNLWPTEPTKGAHNPKPGKRMRMYWDWGSASPDRDLWVANPPSQSIRVH